jgi:dGTPase
MLEQPMTEPSCANPTQTSASESASTEASPEDLSAASLKLPPGIAVLGMESSGSGHDPLATREYPEQPHPYRTAFARDAGRILHAKAFRRLAGKTQVFTRRDSESDHSRSRLTHTLEVTQIARTVASALGLNTELVEALALAHDIGHPPFGHAGEEALDRCLRCHGLSFDHNLHALRIVTLLEDRYAEFHGLNLTLGVREGIVKHSRDYTHESHPELSPYLLDQRPPLEAQLIDLADEIAYLTADMEDGLAAGILTLPQLREEALLFGGYCAQAQSCYPNAGDRLLATDALRRMLNALTTDLIQEIGRRVQSLGITTLQELRQYPGRIAHLSEPVESLRAQAKRFLYANLYQSSYLEAEHDHAEEVIQSLFTAWTSDPALLPADHYLRVEQEGAPRAVADYLAGMTDTYIEQAWQQSRANSATARPPGIG